MAKRTPTRPYHDQLAFDLRVQTCLACQRELAGWDFPQNKKRKQGLAGYCYACWREKQRAYYAKWIQDADYRESRRNKWRRWRQSNPEAARENGRKYRLANRDKLRESCRAWRRENPEANRASVRLWNQRHPEAARSYEALRRARQRSSTVVPFSRDELAQRWAYYGNRCWICREAASATDHVKPLSKGGAHMLCNLRPICKPCNSAKHNKWPFTPEMIAGRRGA
ncbi:HNH endonuclease [Mycobacterium sp. 23]|uniref:HNH endonuclease n=1 Tax=Mycobacterium sp. 23 TaxID=3400424 RepID=UPI003AAF914E